MTVVRGVVACGPRYVALPMKGSSLFFLSLRFNGVSTAGAGAGTGSGAGAGAGAAAAATHPPKKQPTSMFSLRLHTPTSSRVRSKPMALAELESAANPFLDVNCLRWCKPHMAPDELVVASVTRQASPAASEFTTYVLVLHPAAEAFYLLSRSGGAVSRRAMPGSELCMIGRNPLLQRAKDAVTGSHRVRTLRPLSAPCARHEAPAAPPAFVPAAGAIA